MELEQTILREFSPILRIKDHFPKLVISMDNKFKDNYEGVRHMHLLQFLIDEQI